jgi:hypothetical protein
VKIRTARLAERERAPVRRSSSDSAQDGAAAARRRQQPTISPTPGLCKFAIAAHTASRIPDCNGEHRHDLEVDPVN